MLLDRTNRTHLSDWWWTVDRYTLTAISLITAIGFVLVMAASPTVAERIGLSSFYFVNKQAFFLVLGAGIIISFSVLPPTLVRRIAVLGFLGCLFLLLMVLIFGDEAKGAQRWIRIAGFSLQPSEFIKPFFAVVTAWVLARKNIEEGFPGFKISVGLYLLIVMLLILQPDFGMTIAISTVWAAQMFLAGLPLLWIVAISIFGISGIISAYLFFPHVANRINTFLDPSSGNNYQVAKSLEAFINGGFLGTGPGEGLVKEVIPDAHTDFIFAVAGEELGTLVCLFMVILFAFIVIRGFYIVFKENDLFIILAASGLLIQFGIQAIINMGVTLSLLPNTGMTLPFVSYGGSSTIAISISMGMILSFTRKRYGM